MKKYLFAAAGLVLCLLVVYYAIYYGGFYVDLHPDKPVEVMSKTHGKTIMVKDSDGQFQSFKIRGVDLASSVAGHFSSDYAVEENTWLEWFGLIQEMGANTVRIYTIYDDKFYNAFYKFNSGNDTPLYLIQGLQVSDYANDSGADAYAKDFYTSLKEDTLDVVDVLHGRKNITTNKLKGSGNYRKDVSQWVLGYIVGNEWNPGTIAYTDHNQGNADSYKGKYLYTTEQSSAFEAMLAKIMDGMISYETSKYKTQKLISFQSDPENDPLVYKEEYARQLKKYNRVDAEHLRATGKLKSGYFASYRLYEFCPDFQSYLAEDQSAGMREALDSLNDEYYYDGYTQLLSRYHTVPVVIAGYGFSSSRGTDSADGPLTEKEQGERLRDVYEDVVDSGCSGAVITSWQDEWGRRSWNTSFALDVRNLNRWHDIQSDGHGYGLLSFDPGDGESVCYIDGDIGEWTNEDQIYRDNGLILSVKYDERNVYIMLEKEGLTAEDEVYLPIDVTPKSGSTSCRGLPFVFEREADFLLCMEGGTDSRVLVHSRYEALRENYLMQTEGADPFVGIPQRNSTQFVPIRTILKNQKLVSPEAEEDVLLASKRFDTFETGRLVCGNGNPSAEDYNSQSDYCFGKDIVEIRIPWQMLNFSDPSSMMIHDDYYENYGVEWISAAELYVGAVVGGDESDTAPITMQSVKLRGWGGKVEYHERLKKSYDIMKESWGDRDVS